MNPKKLNSLAKFWRGSHFRPEPVGLARDDRFDGRSAPGFYRVRRACSCQGRGEGGADGTASDMSVAQGDARTVFCHAIAAGSRDSFDEAAQAQSAQVVSRELPLEMLVSVKDELGIVREVKTELHEQDPKSSSITKSYHRFTIAELETSSAYPSPPSGSRRCSVRTTRARSFPCRYSAHLQRHSSGAAVPAQGSL